MVFLFYKNTGYDESTRCFWCIMDFVFILNAVLLGVGLAMDAFSVSCANGLNEPAMKKHRMAFIAGVFGVFQAVMPFLGWICVTTVVDLFSSLEKFIPWASLILLSYIGGKMIFDALRKKEGESSPAVGFGAIILQGVATSIDALSVGFTVAELSLSHVIAESLIIGAVTYIICIAGLFIGKKFGTAMSSKASLLGGVILIVIGIEIFIKGII